MSLLRVDNVCKRFGSLIAVDNVSMTVEPGELRAIIGPNGAGKTTFFNPISGFLAPSSGRIVFDGEDITDLLPARRVLARHRPHVSDHRGVSRADGRAKICRSRSRSPPATVAPLAVASRRRRGRGAHRRSAGNGRPGRKSRPARRRARHGDQRATEIMMALALKPRLLLLDEPTAGMGDQETYDITQLIRKLHHDQKLSIVLIEHDMRVVFHLADRIMVLAEGKMLADGTPREIAANEAVQAAYLGKVAA